MVGEFEFDERAVLETSVPLFPGHDAGMVPVRIRLCGVDLLPPDWDEDRIGEPGWADLSLIDLATNGLLCFRLVRRYGRSAFPLGETGEALLFKLVGERVLVCSPLAGVVVDVPFAELDRDWSAFSRRVEQRFIAEYPVLADDPIWRRADTELDAGSFDWEPWFTQEFRHAEDRCASFDDLPIVKSCQ